MQGDRAMGEGLLMVMKAAGTVLVLAAGTGAGWVVAQGYARRPVELRALRQALATLRAEILYRSSSLAEAWAEVARRSPAPVTALFQEASGRLGTDRAGTAMVAWEAGLKRLAEESSLFPEDLEILRHLGQALGTSGREEQERVLALADQELASAEEIARAEREKNARLWQYLGFALGAAVVLLLV